LAHFDINQIMAMLPHRYPMLLVDRILDHEGNKVVGLKNVSMNEAFFQGHYPGMPIMPGVLIVEAMAQTAAVIVLADPQFKGMIPVIGGMQEVRFRRMVVPGDQLIIEMEMVKRKGTVCVVRGKATVEGQVAAELELTCKLVPQQEP
jgi:3-hydroxyacyl-[acyl-carrier-protein] dehydratase